MILTIDLYTLLVSAGCVVVSVLLGYWKGIESNKEESIQNTINYLIHEGFVKWKRLDNGEVELIPLDSDD